MPDAPDCLLVSHTHWDREWYRTFEAFRARLVDAVDRVLDLLAVDPGWSFQLDGQSVVVEDYLAVRPDRRDELVGAVKAGRLALGPWYVQPDSLLPSGEAHVRNLLEGRRVADAHGGCATVAYTPDSFGHPAQLPAIFAGFGLGPFVYWRGNGDELDELGSVYRWRAPDGSAVVAFHLARGYFNAGCLPSDATVAARQLTVTGTALLEGTGGAGPILLMNGVDHQLPDAHTAEVADALAAETGWHVRRGLLDELGPMLAGRDLPAFTGALVGGKVANLLAGVWSTRSWIKVANRRAEAALEGWAEPWVALGRVLGASDERPAVRSAWRTLLVNQAHDSICGCSQDRVHEQMRARFDSATELAGQTATRMLERVAGLGPDRRVPWSTGFDVAVFNPSPHRRTDVVTLALDGYPLYAVSDQDFDIHPLALAAGTVDGYTLDGDAVRTVRSEDPGRVRMLVEWPALDVEAVVRDVPAFGWKRVRLEPGPARPDAEDDGREIAAGDVSVRVAPDGTLTVRLGGREWRGLGQLEDVGDRGDTYDFELDAERPPATVQRVAVRRLRHASGIQRLVVTRELSVAVKVMVEARVAPGVERVDLRVVVDNAAEDHRLRLRFPTGAPADESLAATTFDVARRSTVPPQGAGWVQPPPSTFPSQGWVSANGLTVAAPGLAEAEVTPDGVIAVTLLRAVGWMSRVDLPGRPVPAGPAMPTPLAQCPGRFEARCSLLVSVDPTAVRDAELGLAAVPAGDAPLVEPGHALLTVEPRTLVLSALKPAVAGDGIVLRVLNPTDEPVTATVALGFPVRAARLVRLDEQALASEGREVAVVAGALTVAVGAHGIRTVLLEP